MKVLISNAVWGEDYCSVFAKFSLATLLSPGNIPALATRASVTYHIVTTRRDRRRLLRDPAIAELGRHCTIEWVLIEDYGIFRPPTGPGGEKYPFLSALQNIAINRSLDHDAIVFNYADFIWADGSLSVALDMLWGSEERIDAVLAFCLPVDRDAAMPVLAQYRQSGGPGIIKLRLRDAARIAVERMHREARGRLWDSPRFTNLPSYVMWPADGQGVVLRAYHQSILAMRVRADDPQYCVGIARGGLDSAFTGQLAKSGALAFANDTDKALVFSLYHTPVDSRVPPGVTREMSLQSLLRADVIPEQRRFAEFPFFLRSSDGDDIAWQQVADQSLRVLQEAEASTVFDQAAYDRNYETHGAIPKIARKNAFERGLLWRVCIVSNAIDRNSAAIRRAVARMRRIVTVFLSPSLLDAALERRFPTWGHAKGVCHVPRRSSLLRALIPGSVAPPWRWQRLRTLQVTPNVWIPRHNFTRFGEAIAVEDSSRRVTDSAAFMSALHVAEATLRRVIELNPLWIEAVRALGRNLWFQGCFNEAIRTFAKAEELRDEAANAAGWPIDACVFLPRNCVEVIGLMGHIDAFVKHKILTADPRPYYLLTATQNVVNSAFLEYWSSYIKIVSAPDEVAQLERLEGVYGVNWNWVMPKDGEIVFVHEAIAAIQRAWHKAGREPLLRLCQANADTLRKVRAKWGMTESDPFICLHVRSAGYYGEAPNTAQQFRNSSLESYYAMVRAVTGMGYWLIRMGDPSMPPLDLAQCGNTGRVIDYARLPEKSAELDVALCAECTLFVSSNSGLHTVAHAFGRPVCEVNYVINCGFPWHVEDIFSPPLYLSREKDRVLTLPEVLGSDIIHCDHQFLLERAGISLIPNEPDDIVEIAREALSPEDYHLARPVAADVVQAEFAALNQQHNRGISGRLGRYFAAKHSSRLLGRPIGAERKLSEP